MATHLLGIRHHGPGSARHVMEVLQSLKPDIILIEGPPEGESMLEWVIHEDMIPPVALLAYVPDNPLQAVFYPFTTFSPEWQAMKYGLNHKIPVRFIDMPLVHKLAEKEADSESEGEGDAEILEKDEVSDKIRKNPIDYLAEIAGFEDSEEWWEHHFEIAHQPSEVFEAVNEMMSTLREDYRGKESKGEKIREAFMRRAIRTAEREIYTNIAVICGAWHVPALQNMPEQKEDDALLKNLPKVKVETTWIPWTNDRLSAESGYGAGVTSPGWYQHCWSKPDDDGTLWLTYSAGVFRKNKIDISSAHIIEAVRLSNALAALRNLSKVSLKELNEATQSVMCMGDEILMKLVWKDLIVGNQLGQIPEGTPQIPLQRDMEKQIKSLRLKVSNEDKNLTIDLREESGLQKSILLHRLLLLDVEWGRTQYVSGKGTFKEEWVLRWFPELTIRLLEKAPWGNTLESACNNYLISKSKLSVNLSEVTELIQRALPAELHTGVNALIKRMDELSSTTSDIEILMDAFIPLVQIRKYGNVRKTDLERIGVILNSIFYRMLANLPLSCSNLDDQQANSMAEKIREVHQSVMLLDEEDLKNAWIDTLSSITNVHLVAAEIHGTCCKMLYDVRYFNPEETANEFSKALSINNESAYSAGWLEGFLKEAAIVLILDEVIWGITNDWVSNLEEETFLQIIPLLRRTFSVYNPVEKNKIAQKVKYGKSGGVKTLKTANFDSDRAEAVLPILKTLLGLH